MSCIIWQRFKHPCIFFLPIWDSGTCYTDIPKYGSMCVYVFKLVFLHVCKSLNLLLNNKLLFKNEVNPNYSNVSYSYFLFKTHNMHQGKCKPTQHVLLKDRTLMHPPLYHLVLQTPYSTTQMHLSPNRKPLSLFLCWLLPCLPILNSHELFWLPHTAFSYLKVLFWIWDSV